MRDMEFARYDRLRARWRPRRRAEVCPQPTCGDRGLSTIEVVILAPVIILMVLILVAFGQLVDGRGAVDGAARDAARAGSIEHSRSEAIQQAVSAAQSDLKGTCTSPATVTPIGDTSFQPDTLFTIQVTCTVRGLSFLGLPIRKTVTSTSASPLDPFRRSAT